MGETTRALGSLFLLTCSWHQDLDSSGAVEDVGTFATLDAAKGLASFLTSGEVDWTEGADGVWRGQAGESAPQQWAICREVEP